MALRSSGGSSGFKLSMPSFSGGVGETKGGMTKLVVAGVCLVVAVGLLAWNFGVFGGGAEPIVITPEQQKQLDAASEADRKLAEKLAKDPKFQRMGEQPTPPK